MESLCNSAPPLISKKEPSSTTNSLASSSLTNDGINNRNYSLSGKRSNSNDNKYHLTITSERLAELKKKVDDSLREHKTFTIKGKLI